MKFICFFAFFSIVFSLGLVSAVTPLDNCQILEEEGEYRLTKDLESTGTCFTIRGKGIVLDGSGFEIRGDGTGTGIRVHSSIDSAVVGFSGISNFDRGISLGSTVVRPKLENLVIKDNQDIGLRMEAVLDANVSNLTSAGNGGDGVFVTASSKGNEFSDLFLSNNGGNGFHSIISEGTVIYNLVSEDNSLSGLLVSAHSSLVVLGGRALNNGGNNVEVSYSSKGNVFAGLEYGSFLEEESVLFGSDMERKWYLDLRVVDSSAGSVEGSHVEIKNDDGLVVFTGKTDSEGRIQTQELTYYVNNEGVREFESAYTITASKDGVSKSVEVLMDQNKEVEIVLDLEEKQDGTILSGCQTIKEPGRYVLEENLEWNSKNRRCIDIRSDDVTLDCRGNSIVNERTTRYAIRATKVDDVTIQNCKIETPRGKGIRLYRTKEAKILDNEFEVRSRAISLVRSTKAVISDNSIIARNNAVHLYRSNNNDVSDNEVGSKKVGFRLIRSNNNDFTGNFIDAVKNFVVRKSKGNAF